MVPEQESNVSEGSGETTQTARPFKRPRRAGRGRRGRGRRPPSSRAEPAPQQPSDLPKSEFSEPQPTQSPVSYEATSYSKEPERLQETPVASAPPRSLEQAILEVNHIIENLRETLDEMEEVLETLEFAERQKDADEREIESLRRSLRHLHRPRDEQRKQD
jgi:hypothetical protein